MASATLPKVNDIGDNPAPAHGDIGAPVVIDFGKHRRKAVKRLRQGSGKLMDRVNATLDELRSAGAIAAGAQPVIIVVQQRTRRRGLLPSI